MKAEEFLEEHPKPQPWKDKVARGLSTHSVFLGQGANALEVAVASAAARPLVTEVRALWKQRHGRRPSPLLLVVLYDGKAALCGPVGEEPPVYDHVDAGQAERLARQAIAEPDRHAATRLLTSMLPETEQELPGIRNAGMFSAHALRTDVPTLPQWPDACRDATKALDKRGKELIEALGFTIERHDQSVSFLRSDKVKRAVAMFLDENETPEADSARFNGMSPVSYALAIADRENVPYVLLTRGPQIRLYASATDVGVGRKGRSETFVEANLALLPDDRAGYLPMVFGAQALIDGGTFQAILERSRDFASDLGTRLRERVYNEVVPHLADALGRRALKGKRTQVDLDFLYQQTLVILFRLLFVAYAEDKDLLPYHRNDNYRRQALKTLARELADRDPATSFDKRAKSYWVRVRQLWRAVDEGDADLGVPPYNGGLFSEEEHVSGAGAALAKVELTNSELGPALHGMLVDVGSDGASGPVDFRSLSVREFGTIYEGLLESNLAVAPTDLALDKEGTYIPVTRKKQEIVVAKGEVYLHNRSGARKATGSYFTKPFAVEHLLRHSLEPSLTEHLARIKAHLDSGEDHKAADSFFDFRCADIAMGSGHFLVAAVDHIEARLSSFLAENPIPGVRAELERLRAAARTALKNVGREVDADDLEDSQLLRRQVARRCVYGVDKNRIAVELSRLALWIHTFVPGLPLSFLDHSLVHGDSLTGIGTLDEALEILDPKFVRGKQLTSMYRPQIDEWMQRSEEALRKLGLIEDASAKEIADARAAHEEAQTRIEPARDLFDLLVSVRLGDVVPLLQISDEAVQKHSSLESARAKVAELKSLHFPIAFPEVFLRSHAGFDSIVGNPPWDKVMFEPQQFWVTRVPGLNSLPDAVRDKRIVQLRKEMPAESQLEEEEKESREEFQRFLKASYRYLGGGHYDYSKAFLERAVTLLQDRGRLGYVLPRQSLVLGGWSKLRELVLTQNHVGTLQARNKGGWIFDDVDNRYMVALMTRGPADNGASGVSIWPAITDPAGVMAADEDNALSLSEIELRSLTDTLVVPWFSGPRDPEVFNILRTLPRISGKEGWVQGTHDARWDFRETGPHRRFSAAKGADESWRILMTRAVHAFRIDPSAEVRRFVRRPQELIPLKSGVERKDGSTVLGSTHPVLVVRHPSRSDDARTLIAAALAEEGEIHNKGYVHAIRHNAETQPDVLLALAAWLNTYLCDWWARRFVDRHITAPVINSLPLPLWTPEDIKQAAAIATELFVRGGATVLAGGMSLKPVHEFAEVSDDELLVRVEVLAFRGCGLKPSHTLIVMEDFSAKGCPPARRQAILEARW